MQINAVIISKKIDPCISLKAILGSKIKGVTKVLGHLEGIPTNIFWDV